MSQSVISYRKGDVVLAPFPYQQDVEEEKLRPVVLLAPSDVGGFISAYVTSKSHRPELIKIQVKDFKEGCINDYEPSYVRPCILYTVATTAIVKKYGALKDDKFEEIIRSLVGILQQPRELAPVSRALQRPERPKRVF